MNIYKNSRQSAVSPSWIKKKSNGVNSRQWKQIISIFTLWNMKSIPQGRHPISNIFLLISIISINSYISIGFSFAQIAVGEWRDHLPYSHALKVTEAENKIYCSTDISLFSYNKDDNSIEKLSKITGLSDVDFSSIEYSKENKVLLIAYSNGNIDLIENNTIYNISDIKRKQITGNKTINNIMFIDHYAYLSCGFGIVVLDIERKEIKDTYYIGENGSYINVFEMTFDGDSLYAATESGIYKADINCPNLLDFANWTRITNFPNYNNKFNTITYFNDKIYVNFHTEEWAGDTIYIYNDDSWEYFDTSHTYSTHFSTFSLSVNYEKLIIVFTYKIHIVDTEGNTTKYNSQRSKDAVLDKDNILWVADNRNGLIKNNNPWDFENIFPNGPLYKSVVDISIEGDNLWVAAGGRDGSWNNISSYQGTFAFSNEQWKSYNSNNTTGMENIFDLVNVCINPANPNQVFIASWGCGVLEFNNGEFIRLYNEANSTLQNVEGLGYGYIRIGGLAFDSDNNLWVTNSGVENPISIKKTDGNWKSLEYGNLFNSGFIGDIIVTKYNHKWVMLPRGKGLFIFDEKNTFEDLNDDNTKEFDIRDENGAIINNDIFSIAEDMDGTIWIGTAQGVVVYYNPENVFSDENFYAQRIIIDIDGSAQYLLETETVTAIAIDGANRKWFGTGSSGVFLMSEDGTEQIFNFNTDNSPLLSNVITSIAINHNTGEVFFGTDKGIISYKSTATKGDDEFNQVYVYPNPVRENYSGLITIKGLVSASNVKITDISGNIVYETTAQGGQAIWDGKNFSGKKVHTGVYLVFCSNEDGSKTFVTKLLFIN